MIKHITNRKGLVENFDKDKIRTRLLSLAPGMANEIDIICGKLDSYLYENMHTSDIDKMTAWICEFLALSNTKYAILMSSILHSDMNKNIEIVIGRDNNRLISLVNKLYKSQQISQRYRDFVIDNVDELNKLNTNVVIKGSSYDIVKKYSRKINEIPMELPEDLFMRTAIVTTQYQIEDVKDMYEMLRTLRIIYGTPTITNSATLRPQLASCFVLDIEDTTESQIRFLANTARIISNFGGVGSSLHKVRSVGSKISTGTGKSTGIVAIVNTLKKVSKQFNQQVRSGSHAIYLMPTHPEIMDFLNAFSISRNNGKRMLFPAMWIPDEFFRCVLHNKPWYLINPQYHDIVDLYDSEMTDEWIENPDPVKHAFTYRYRAIQDGNPSMDARAMYIVMLKQMLLDGVPYMMSKDNTNRTNNHDYLGCIRGSNLCTEIVQYKDDNNIAVCNIGSIVLPNNVTNNRIDNEKIKESVYAIVVGLNNVIDQNVLPCIECKSNTNDERPIGIGIQGLAEIFAMYGYAFDSEEALELSGVIAELLYYYALDASCELAKVYGPFKGFKNSHLGKTKFNWELYNEQNYSHKAKPRLDWEYLRNKIKQYGVRNSLLIAYMPTGTTSGLCGYTPCFEPFNGMVYKRSTMSGERTIINEMLMSDLVNRGITDENILNEIISSDNGIGYIGSIPEDIRNKYKCIYEIDPKIIIEHSIRRAPYIDQSSSMNLFLRNARTSSLSECLFAGWRGGLKTLSYYTRVKPQSGAQKLYTCESCSTS